MILYLSHAPNPDVKDGYWVAPLDSGDPVQIDADSLADASLRCCRYIERNELGGGNWTGGQVFDGEKLVASIGYNGRVWWIDGRETML